MPSTTLLQSLWVLLGIFGIVRLLGIWNLRVDFRPTTWPNRLHWPDKRISLKEPRQKGLVFEKRQQVMYALNFREFRLWIMKKKFTSWIQCLQTNRVCSFVLFVMVAFISLQVCVSSADSAKIMEFTGFAGFSTASQRMPGGPGGCKSLHKSSADCIW